VANLLLAFASWHVPCRPFLAKYYSAAVRLPSDWMNVADLSQTIDDAPPGTLPAALRRAMAEKFGDFDEYQLAKYNKKGKGKKKKEESKKVSFALRSLL
jgi:telomerase protein component 1